MTNFEHPIFFESMRLIRQKLGDTGLDPLQQKVLERLIHSSGDFGITSLLRFSPGACDKALEAIKAGAPILTDTKMALEAVSPTVNNTVKCLIRTVLEWSPDQASLNKTRTAVGMEKAWDELSKEFQGRQSPIVLIGSAPTALISLLDLIIQGAPSPSLIIGMPVGFIGVEQSKFRLSNSNVSHILLEGSRGGAALAGATINALLRESELSR